MLLRDYSKNFLVIFSKYLLKYEPPPHPLFGKLFYLSSRPEWRLSAAGT